ncbi:Rab effector Noc2, partial [Eufriesea mexicana]
MDITVKDISGGTRWVCPSDRHLSLRAKLQTGWSVKAASLDSKWGTYSNSYSGGTNRCAQSFVLTEEEQQTIIQVIQRAEALNLSEQERIGRLVERLENMKHNVCIVTTTRLNERKRCSSRCFNSAHCVCSCALCGEKFGTVLGASANLCKDCRKYICQKCGIETNELNSTLSNISTMREKTQERTTVQRIVRRSSSNQKQFLCRICAETREMWKKSGAWFLKGMPKYILPEKKERGWSRSVYKTSTWTIGGNKSHESTEFQDSSSDEETTRRLALARGQSSSISSLQKNQDNTTNKIHSTLSDSVQSTSSTSKSPGQRSNGLLPLNSREEYSDQLDRSTLSISSQCNRLSPSPTSPRSRINPKASNDSQIEQHVSFEGEIIDEKNRKLDDINEATRKLEFNSYEQSKSTQVQSPRSNFTTVPTTPTMTITATEQLPDQNQIHEKRMDQEGRQSSSEQENLPYLCSNNQVNLRQQMPEYGWYKIRCL